MLLLVSVIINSCIIIIIIIVIVRVILAAQSEYFKSMLLGSMREAQPNSEIVLEGVSPATVRLLVKFAYCGRVQLENVSLQVYKEAIVLAILNCHVSFNYAYYYLCSFANFHCFQIYKDFTIFHELYVQGTFGFSC